MLQHLNISQLRLMTNNPRKVSALELLGIPVVERIPLLIIKSSHNRRYLDTKASKLGHLLEGND